MESGVHPAGLMKTDDGALPATHIRHRRKLLSNAMRTAGFAGGGTEGTT